MYVCVGVVGGEERRGHLGVDDFGRIRGRGRECVREGGG